MCTVGQDEIVIVLECAAEDAIVPRDVFLHLQAVYEEASHGRLEHYPLLASIIVYITNTVYVSYIFASTDLITCQKKTCKKNKNKPNT